MAVPELRLGEGSGVACKGLNEPSTPPPPPRGRALHNSGTKGGQ